MRQYNAYRCPFRHVASYNNALGLILPYPYYMYRIAKHILLSALAL